VDRTTSRLSPDTSGHEEIVLAIGAPRGEAFEISGWEKDYLSR
jgi:hypothetical protein